MQSFGAIVRANAARKDAGAVAVTYPDGELTWHELDRRSNQLARLLQSRDVVQDDLVVILLPNGIAYHLTAVAIWKAGATPCVFSPNLPPAELRDILDVARPRLVMGSLPDGLTTVPQVDPLADLAAFDDAPVADLTPRYWKAVGSGGSTGRPKIIVDHGPGALDETRAVATAMGMPRDGVVLNPGPLYHNGPFIYSSHALLDGAQVVGMARFDAEEFLRLVEQYRVQWVCVVPTMMHRIWALPTAVREKYDLSSLRAVWHMAAHCPPWLKQAWIDWLGPDRIWEAYGGTEGFGCAIGGAEWLLKPGSVGRVAPGTLRIVDEDGRDLPAGEIGEIYLAKGGVDNFHYLGAEQKADASQRITIGDMGHLDEDGYLFLADRRTDLIVRGGANIYPAEIEAALDEHPAIGSSVAVGLPDDEFGQRVHAIIQAKPGHALDIDAVHSFLADRLVSYKRPESYEIADTPLRDDAGKVRRSQLKIERATWMREGRQFRLQPERLPKPAAMVTNSEEPKA